MPYLDFNGHKIAYRDHGGDGTPVLLVHGFPFHSEMWEPQIDALGDRFRFVTIDLLGFGESDAPHDRSAYSIETYADQLKAVVDALGVGKVVLVGLSMGGYVTFAFMRKYRDFAAGIVLADTRAEADVPEITERRTAQQKQVSEKGTEELIDTLTGTYVSQSTIEKKRDVVERVKSLMDNPAYGFIGALEAMKNRLDSTDGLVEIKVPTLIVVGENDALTPPELSRKMHEHIGESRLVVLPEAGHMSNLESPDAFNGALAEFLGPVSKS
jgi:3-oxoadipate enol-lactonase